MNCDTNSELVREGGRLTTALPCIGDYLDHYAEHTPDAIAIVFGDEKIDYARLKVHVDQFARALFAAGIQKGDRVAMLCTSRPEFWIVFLATTRIGAIWVGLNPKYKLREMQHVVADAEPKLAFSLSGFEGRNYASDVDTLVEGSESLGKVVCLDSEMDGCERLESFLHGAESCIDEAYVSACSAVDSSDPALIVYTSGTTGAPKGAVLSHHSISAGAMLQTEHLRVDDPAMVVSFPINHVACVADTCATTYVKGGKIVFQERFDPAATLKAIEDERCTFLGGVPTMLQMMLAQPQFKDTDMSSVELVAWGGAAMPADLVSDLTKVCPRLMPLYGMTETAAHVVYGEEGATVEQMANSIGKPDPSLGCRIVTEEGDECGVGVTGELQFKASFLMQGYWRNVAATDAAFTQDGWLKTGDLAEWRDDGNIRLVGRLSEMFKSGGYNVYPREIEIALESLPGVAMAAVISVPDDLYQEVGRAYIVPAAGDPPSVESLRDACREWLANYKVPKEFEVARDLPLLPVGKIDKQALRKAAKDDREKGVD